jgi:hypothetical protein
MSHRWFLTNGLISDNKLLILKNKSVTQAGAA